ncbi:MAG: hypothetical protein K1000chlam3_01527 [Chlamydiae bacterium]|nr:hypothetical protein [Chlamydiota bacterium]
MGDKKAEEQMINEFVEKTIKELMKLLEETGRIEVIIAYLMILDTVKTLTVSLPLEDVLNAIEMMAKHNKEFYNETK